MFSSISFYELQHFVACSFGSYFFKLNSIKNNATANSQNIAEAFSW